MMADPALVGALVGVYHDLVRKHSRSAFRYTYHRPGESARSSLLWRKLEEIVDHCASEGIPPVAYLSAQFRRWRMLPGFEGAYPTPRFIGVTEACKARYRADAADASSPAIPEDLVESAVRTVEAVLRNRPGLTEDGFFRDPLLVRLVEPSVARAHPAFARAVEAGVYSDPAVASFLEGYL